MAAAQPSTGREFLHYRIVQELGAGGMGIVYKAIDTRLDRPVALKFLPAALQNLDHLRRRFETEAKAASALDHVNVGTIYGVEESPDGQPFIVMAFYEGETLAAKTTQGPLPAAKAIDYALQVTRGLTAAHEKRILHRDIKSSNIIITNQGVAKIVDFGIAVFDAAPRQTRTGEAVGTPHYMSPEQAMGKDLDQRTDVWSLGIVLFEMLTGTLPFSGDSVYAVTHQIVHEPLPDLPASTPPKLAAIVHKALAKDRDHRYASARQMGQALLQLANPGAAEADTLSASIPVPPPKKRPWWVYLPLLLVLAWPLLWLPRNATPNHELYLQAVKLVEQRGTPGNLDKAIALFQQCAKADPTFALAQAKLGEAYFLKYRMESDPSLLTLARQSSNNALGLDKEIPAAYVTLGNIDDGTGQHDLALQEFQSALKIDPRNIPAYQGLAKAYDSMGRPKDAEDTLKKTIDLTPGEWQVYSKLGKFYSDHNRLPEAMEQYRQVVKLAPDNATGYSNLGAILLETGDYNQASQMFSKSIQLSPTYFAYSNLGTILYRQGHYSEAAKNFQQALALNSKDYTLLTNIAICARRINGFNQTTKLAYQDATKATEAFLQSNAQDAGALAALANLKAWLGEAKQAELLAQQAMTLSQNNSDIELSAAGVFEHDGKREQALKLISSALQHGATSESIVAEPDFAQLTKDPAWANVH